MTTEQEKSEVTEQEATLEPEQPVSEVPTLEAEQPTPEAQTKTVQQELADKVRACVVESRACEDLGAKFDDAAKELGIEVNELIAQIFEILTTKEG